MTRQSRAQRLSAMLGRKSEGLITGKTEMDKGSFSVVIDADNGALNGAPVI